MIRRMEPTSYDLIVIGSGPAGESGAAAAALFGKRVAMVEKSALVGGASANTGTLPSKTLRESALAISGLKARDLYGVDLSLPMLVRARERLGDSLVCGDACTLPIANGVIVNALFVASLQAIGNIPATRKTLFHPIDE